MQTTGDYRIFVGAFPGGAVAAQLQQLRLHHDPVTARITAPHVTLAGTYWRSGPPTPENEAVTQQALVALAPRLAPFTLELGGIATFPPSHRVIYLAVQTTPALQAVRAQLLSVIGPDKHRHYHPHLTLAMRLPAAPSQALFEELRQSPWHTTCYAVPIDRLYLMQRGPQDAAWRAIQELPLLATHNSQFATY